jgi:hypothetical protein
MYVHVLSSGDSSNAKVSLSIYKDTDCDGDDPSVVVKAEDVKLKGLYIEEDLSSVTEEGTTIATVDATITVVDKLNKEELPIELFLEFKNVSDVALREDIRDITVIPEEVPDHDSEELEKYKAALIDADAKGRIGIGGWTDDGGWTVELDRCNGAFLAATEEL